MLPAWRAASLRGRDSLAVPLDQRAGNINASSCFCANSFSEPCKMLVQAQTETIYRFDLSNCFRNSGKIPSAS